MTSSRIAIGSVLAVLLLAFATSPASALSFSVPAGRTIVDLDLSTDAAGFAMEGDPGGTPPAESFSLTADVDALRLDDGSSVLLAPGQVRFDINLRLVANTVSTGGDFFGATASAAFRNGLAFDLTLTDTTTSELVLGADFTADVILVLNESFAILSGGNLGQGPDSGAFLVSAVAPALAGQVLPGGDISATLTAVSVSSLAAALDADQEGFQDFTAQPNLDFNFVADVAEPGSALLLGVAALGAFAIQRRRV